MKSNKSFIVVLGLMIFGVFARLIPHIPNFTPTESIAIFGSAFLGYRYMSFLLPLGLIFIADFIINNTIARSFFPDTQGLVLFSSYMIYTAIAIVAIVLLSKTMLKTINVKNVVLTVLASTVIFFLLTNFAAWADPKSLYPANASGLIASYIAGLPFVKVSLLGNLIFSGVLFGGKALIESMLESKQAVA